MKKQDLKNNRKMRKPLMKTVGKDLETPILTEEELKEEIHTFLTTQNPYLSDKCVEFDHKTQCFKPVFEFKKPIIFYQQKSCIKKRLKGLYGIVYEEIDVKAEDKEDKMKNKFNFRNVAVQTQSSSPVDKCEGVDANMFPVLKFGGTASRSEIVAAYKEHETKTKEKDETVGKIMQSNVWMKDDLNALAKLVGRNEMKFQARDRFNLKLFERMLDQNMSGANLDFTYYDNPNDEFRPKMGSLLPLWSLSSRISKDMLVTSICWNFHYQDLFAVGFRTLGEEFETDHEEEDLESVRELGCVCVYSLKGPSYPEKIIECTSGVCCVQFHRRVPHLLAVALTGGDLDVYDLRKEGDPLKGKCSNFEKLQHGDNVVEVEWLENSMHQKLCSIANDGKIINWSLVMSDLHPNELVAELRIKEFHLEPPPKGLEMHLQPKREPKDTIDINTIGTSLSVNRCNSNLFLVATVSGVVHEYKFDDKTCDATYEGHGSSVGQVRWNPFHPQVFLSSSKDLTIQVWEQVRKQSLFEFFFDGEVIDVSWAPFSSTLFAAISGNAEVSVFDLAVDKRSAIGTYVVYTRKQAIQLTRIQFHPLKPILIVGDDRGRVILLKLSPNLRSSLNAMNALEWPQFVEKEVEKMDKLLKVSINPEV